MRDVKTIYFDESGFTGNNLLDMKQPIFTISSTDISPNDAKKILQNSFPTYMGEEFKFKNIWKSSRGKTQLIDFAKTVCDLGDSTFTWVIDKKFAVLTKLVDHLIEPVIHDAGYDFYSDGFCWKYANYIHYGFSTFCDPKVLEGIVTAYQKFSRNPSDAELNCLRKYLRKLAGNVDSNVEIFVDQMAVGAELFKEYHELKKFISSDELQFTSMLSIIAHWRQGHTEDFKITHDASSNFSRKRDLWNKITSNDTQSQDFMLGDGTSVEFPLRVLETRSTDSKDNYSVQFCDLLAGLVAKCYSDINGADNLLLINSIKENGFNAIPQNGILFSPIFPDQFPPNRLNEADAVDQMADIIYR